MPTSIRFYPAKAIGLKAAGVLRIDTPTAVILSLPSQRGCMTGCTFCNSGGNTSSRNLSSCEMARMARSAMKTEDANRTIELSFTGEGEPLVNWKQVTQAVDNFTHDGPVRGRLSTSGFAAKKLLNSYVPARRPCRLQVSLHCASQDVRDRLIPRSVPLQQLRTALLENAHKFKEVSVNVVLQEGVNDSERDLLSLQKWLVPGWRVTMNALLSEQGFRVAPRTQEFARELRGTGHRVDVFESVARQVSQLGIYPALATTSNSSPLSESSACKEEPRPLGRG